MRVQSRSLLAALFLPLLSTVAAAEDWVVSKATGQVWHAPSNAQPVSLGAEARLAPGDLVQTGPTGRVMLTRGGERILVAPNSVISLPKSEDKPGFTTILQQAGSIAVEAEKKDHKHFEVLTPYLAAVVKGTQFTVSIGKGTADVNVMAGKVEVADVKSGLTALVLPGQFAKVGGPTGLRLGGQGSFEPITKGAPRSGTPAAVTVPRQGFTAAPRVEGGLRVDKANVGKSVSTNAVRLEKALGPIALNAGAATSGLIRTEGNAAGSTTGTGTIWTPATTGNAGSSSGSGSSSNASSSGNGAGAGSSPVASGATPAAAGIGAGPGAGASGAPGAAAGLGGNAGGNGVGNAFGLNGGNGIGKAFGLAKKH